MTGKKNTGNESESSIFRAAMSDASPIATGNRVNTHRTPRPPKPRIHQNNHEKLISELAEPPADWIANSDIQAGDEMSYRGEGVQANTLRKLRRGQYAVEAELDLHGHTVKAARAALADFILECHQFGWRCVRIIHGKGRGSGARGPVIKASVDYWLRERPEITAFCSARPADGGTGAVYALLRNPDKNKSSKGSPP